MKHPIKMRLVEFLVLKAFTVDYSTHTLGTCTESLLLIFAGKGVQSEVQIPITSDNGLGSDINVVVSHDEDIEGLVWVNLLTRDGSPLSVEIGNSFLWETGMPFSLN